MCVYFNKASEKLNVAIPHLTRSKVLRYDIYVVSQHLTGSMVLRYDMDVTSNRR